MSTDHTPGRMQHQSLMGTIVVGSREETIFHCGLGLRHNAAVHEQAANAARLVACWNALEDHPTEDLPRIAARLAQDHEARQFITGTAMPSLRHVLTMIDDGKPIEHIRVELQALLMRAARTV